MSIYSSTILHCNWLFSSVLYFFIHLNILFFSLCISLSFTIYHGIRATVVSLFTQSGEQLDPHSAEPHGSSDHETQTLSQGLESSPSNSWKIRARSLQRLQSVLRSKERGSRDWERRNFKVSCNLFKESSKIDEEKLQEVETLKELEENVQNS